MVRLERTITAHTAVPRQLAFSPDGIHLASASVDSTVRLWRTAGGAAARMLKHPTAIASLAFSRDGQRLASGGYDGVVRVWRLSDDGTPVRTLIGHTAAVWSVAFSPEGARRKQRH